MKHGNKEIIVHENNGKTVLKICEVIEIDSANFEQRVKVIAYLKDLDLGDIAKQFGVSQKNNFLRKLSVGKLKFTEMYKIAKILGTNIVINFTIGDKIIEAESSSELIRKACAETDTSLLKLAEYLTMSRQALGVRMKSSVFTYKELAHIAGFFGGTYNNYFEIEGIRI